MGDLLGMDNILSPSDIDNLFNSDVNNQEVETKEKETKVSEETDSKNETTEVKVDPSSLFKPESVGSEEDIKGKKDTVQLETGTSPNSFYSSIAKAFREDGVFPDLSKDDFNDVTDALSFRRLIDKQITASLDERQQRIDKALNYGVEPSEINNYEKTIDYLNGIQDSSIEDEGEAGENLRKNLIYQSYINRGYSKERATREVTKSFNGNTDIEDAKEALEDNKEFYSTQYDNMLKEAQKAEEESKLNAQKQAEELRKSILEDSEVFDGLEIDKKTRQKVYDNMMKPVYKNPKNGNYLTALQKYQQDKPQDFFRNVGLLYTLTDGFKNLDNLIKDKVKREVTKGIQNLDKVINGSSRDLNGNLQFLGRGEDNNSIFKGYDLDLS